ncbi:MAG TPA: hypothetical protein VIM33_04810 [Gaiellaceae bacterium]
MSGLYDGGCPSPTRSFASGYWVSCKRRGCSHCGTAWARAWSIVMRENLRHYGARVVMLSLTAPGVERLPWDRSRCKSKAPHRCSGRRGCVVEEFAADAWSVSAPARWAALRQAARLACRRRGEVPNLLARVWEPQKRGVPHLHAVFGVATVEEDKAARAFLRELARLAPEYDFGLEGLDDDHFNPVAPERVSSYVTSYLTGRRGKKGTIRENIADPRMPRSLLWVAAKLTRETHVTMRRLRYARWYLVAKRKPVSVYPRVFGDELFELAHVCAQLERVDRGPPSPTLAVTTRAETKHPHAFEVPVRIVDELRMMRRLPVAA